MAGDKISDIHIYRLNEQQKKQISKFLGTNRIPHTIITTTPAQIEEHHIV